MTPGSTRLALAEVHAVLPVDYSHFVLRGGWATEEIILPDGDRIRIQAEVCAVPSAVQTCDSECTVTDWRGTPPDGEGRLLGEGVLDCPEGLLVTDCPANGSGQLSISLGGPGRYGVKVWRAYWAVPERQEFDVRVWRLGAESYLYSVVPARQ